MIEKWTCKSTMEEVLVRCRAAYADVTGDDRLFSRDFTSEEFLERRKALARKIGDDAQILIHGGPANVSHLPGQDATFYYFTGFEVLECYLLVDGKTGSSTLFAPSSDDEDAGKTTMYQKRLLVDAVKPVSEMKEALKGIKKLFLPFAECESAGITRFLAKGCAGQREKEEWGGTEPRHKAIIRRLGEQFPNMQVEDASDIIGRMRRIKSKAEIEVLRQAGHLSALIMMESMKATRPGLCESHLEGIAKYIYSAYGNGDLGYGVIAASGTRITDGHYNYDNCTMKDGEVVLMDCGPDLRHYSSDIARIWPVNGTYSEWHRQIYGFIVEYHKQLLKQIKPGIFAQDAYAKARAIMRSDYVDKWFPNGDMPAEIDGMLTQGGPYNHCVGLSVHDFVGPWRDEIIEENMVFVVDPMAMFKDKKQYIRVEDTIVVTSDGCESLTGAAPIELDEVEELMKQPSKIFTGNHLI